MAYTNSPEIQTYKTVSIKFEDLPDLRSSSINRDELLYNMYFTRTPQLDGQASLQLVKRPGFNTTNIPINVSSDTSDFRGVFYTNFVGGYLYWATGNKVYRSGVFGTLPAVEVATIPSGNTHVGFCEYYRSSTNTNYVVFATTTGLYLTVVGSNTATQVTDADFPANIVPTPVAMNGYLFVAKEGTTDIYNCVNDDPFSWQAGDYISAEMSGDSVVALANHKNHIVAFGTKTTEFFYDAAITSQSPLQRNDSAFREIGILELPAAYEGRLFFRGWAEGKYSGYYELDNLTFRELPDFYVGKYVGEGTSTVPNALGSGVGWFNVIKAQILDLGDKQFYIPGGGGTSPVFDLQLKIWYLWTVWLLGAFVVPRSGQWVLKRGSSGQDTYFSKFGYDSYSDGPSDPISCLYTTMPITLGTSNWKSCSRLFLYADRNEILSPTNVGVSWRDEDSATATAARNINVNSKSPYITRLGRFRTRRFTFSFTGNAPLRIRQIDLDINVGTS